MIDSPVKATELRRFIDHYVRTLEAASRKAIEEEWTWAIAFTLGDFSSQKLQHSVAPPQKRVDNPSSQSHKHADSAHPVHWILCDRNDSSKSSMYHCLWKKCWGNEVRKTVGTKGNYNHFDLMDLYSSFFILRAFGKGNQCPKPGSGTKIYSDGGDFTKELSLW